MWVTWSAPVRLGLVPLLGFSSALYLRRILVLLLILLFLCTCVVFRTSRDWLHELNDALELEGFLLANDSRSYSLIYRLVVPSPSFVLFCLYDETHHTFSGTSYVRDRSLWSIPMI